MLDLKNLFNPKSVAVVGASTTPGSVGSSVLNNLIQSGFKGKIFPVNPKVDILLGLKCYPDLGSIKQAVDLVVIIVPAVVVPKVLAEAGACGAKAVTIISAGFKESGRGDLEEQIIEIAARYQLPVLGPNCLGFINPYLHLNTTFARLMPSAGNLAFLSQSGAMGTAVLDFAQDFNLGFSLFASVGNNAVLDEADFLNYLRTDKQTKVIGLYSEQLSRPDKLSSVLQTLNSGKKLKPVIILKAGRTMAGVNASASHTGAIAGNDSVYEAFFRENGILRADTVAELFDYLQIFSYNRIAAAESLAIITNAGGPGVLAADAAVINGLKLCSISSPLKSALRKILPPASSVNNPIDILGDADPERYQQSLSLVGKDRKVQSILLLLTVQSMTEVEKVAAVIASWRKQSNKALAVCLLGSSLIAGAREYLRRQGIAVFSYPESAVKSLAALNNFVTYSLGTKNKSSHNIKLKVSTSGKEIVSKIFAQAQSEGNLSLPEYKSLPVLKAYGLPTPNFRLVLSDKETILAKSYFKGAVALKIASPDILHKTEAGGVVLNVAPEDISLARKRLLTVVRRNQPQAKIEGVLISSMSSPARVEVIVGAIRDANLGCAFMLGWGGIYTEIIKDIGFMQAPFDKDKIINILSTLKIGRILLGARGQEALDINILLDIFRRLDSLMNDFPEIKEIDLNPVFVFSKKAIVLDARIILSK